MTRSLRFRILLGAGLWSVGIFGAALLASTAIMATYPGYPIALHRTALYRGGWVLFGVVIACIVAGVLSVRSGLTPVDRLRSRLLAVRNGRDRRIEGEYPTEVQPLVTDLNALLEHRERTVSRALAKAGDLAHGLKTPLAVLSHEADLVGHAGHHELALSISQQIARMRRQVEYHLVQVRAAASGATPGTQCSLAQSAEGLARALRRLHAERGLMIRVCVESDLSVRGERADVDEMVGNLLDNACRWARTQVVVSAARADACLVVTVDDDGPGLVASERERVLQRGVRLDESEPGSGLGLAIVRDLARVYGGSISLDESPLGGLHARLNLPA